MGGRGLPEVTGSNQGLFNAARNQQEVEPRFTGGGAHPLRLHPAAPGDPATPYSVSMCTTNLLPSVTVKSGSHASVRLCCYLVLRCRSFQRAWRRDPSGPGWRRYKRVPGKHTTQVTWLKRHKCTLMLLQMANWLSRLVVTHYNHCKRSKLGGLAGGRSY